MADLERMSVLGRLMPAVMRLIFSGTRDILHPDARLFAQRAVAAAVPVSYTEAPGQLHVFPLFPIPEGRRARRQMIAAVRRALAGRTPPFDAPEEIGR